MKRFRLEKFKAGGLELKGINFKTPVNFISPDSNGLKFAEMVEDLEEGECILISIKEKTCERLNEAYKCTKCKTIYEDKLDALECHCE